MKQYSFNVNGQSAVGKLTWNANGTLQQLAITDPFNSQDNQTCTYTYDALARVSGDNCGSAWAQTFSYDAFGNISKSGSISWLPTYNSPVNNKYLTGWNGVSYDANGDLLNDTFNTYTWDAYGGLASVNGATVTNDAFGRMVENQSRGIELVYSPADGSVLAAMQGQALNTAFVPLPGGTTAGYGIAGDFNYFYPDWLGSVRLLSGETRIAFPIMAYAPFGEGYAGGTPNNGNFTAYGFPFTVFDSENDTGTLEDFMFRRYSPVQGRWISPDPAGLGAANPANPQSWNRYGGWPTFASTRLRLPHPSWFRRVGATYLAA
jgi:RHS repeat-associated protein